MPRTKRRTVKRPSVADSSINVTVANNQQPRNIKEILNEFDSEKEIIENHFSEILENTRNVIENSILMIKMNLGTSLNENLYSYLLKCCPENANGTAVSSTKKGAERPTRAATKTTATRATRQKSASTAATTRTINSATVTKHRSATRGEDAATSEKKDSRFKTPVNRPIISNATVTPKVNMNEPMSMMRRPNQGEVALSMTGSPLMVSSVSRDDMATVSVPLSNGNILSILPKRGVAMDISFDEQTKNELLVLKGNIEGLLKMNCGL